MDHKYIVVGIDGTGSREWMYQDGSNSSTFKFVRDVHYGSMEIDRRWFHGPSNTVTGTDKVAWLYAYNQKHIITWKIGSK